MLNEKLEVDNILLNQFPVERHSQSSRAAIEFVEEEHLFYFSILLQYSEEPEIDPNVRQNRHQYGANHRGQGKHRTLPLRKWSHSKAASSIRPASWLPWAAALRYRWCSVFGTTITPSPTIGTGRTNACWCNESDSFG